MGVMRTVSKAVVPSAVKTRMRLWSWRALDLKWRLRSGPTVQVRSHSEWLVYNDIFVEGEYDLPIRETLESASAGRAIQVLDVGANLGFFTLRVVDLLGQRQGARPDVRMTCIEGSPNNHAELTRRIRSADLGPDKVRIIHGLAGQKSGSAMIFQNPNMNGMNTLFTSRRSGGAEVPFVDVPALFPGDSRIDLLKCDIEGSELSFIEHNPELFRRVDRAVFELHVDLCDVPRCRALLAEAGLTRCRHLWDRPEYGTFTDYFTRA